MGLALKRKRKAHKFILNNRDKVHLKNDSKWFMLMATQRKRVTFLSFSICINGINNLVGKECSYLPHYQTLYKYSKRTWTYLNPPTQDPPPLCHLSCWHCLLQWVTTIDQITLPFLSQSSKFAGQERDLCFSSGNSSHLSGSSVSTIPERSSKSSIFSYFCTLNSYPCNASLQFLLLLSTYHIHPCLHLHTH